MVNKAFAVVGLIIATSLQLAFAHPGEVHVPLPRAELERRRLEAEKRTTLARRCAPQIAEFNAKRRAKRSVVVGPRTFKQRFDRRQDGITTPHVPTFAAIQNSTCVTAPEVTEGPYYVANELLRTDVREGQAGVELTLDIGVMDTRTCTPLADALVEIWACNAVGAYSGFTTAVLGASGNPMSDQNTWLRGGYATNAEGVAEFKTIYPGYYSGRTIHVHTMVQTNYSVATNGSILSHAGQVRHVGQIYFNEDLNNQVVSQPAYLDTRHTRTLNENDGLLASGSANGYNAIAASQLLGDNIANGVLAYITVGVDTAFQGRIRTNNYVTPSAGGGAGAPGATAGASNGARALRPPLLKYFF